MVCGFVTRLVVTGGCSTFPVPPPVASAAEAGARLMKLEASNRARAKLLLGRFFIDFILLFLLHTILCTPLYSAVIGVTRFL
jgi:hypothetical protein